jgi:hypothetical protein
MVGEMKNESLLGDGTITRHETRYRWCTDRERIIPSLEESEQLVRNALKGLYGEREMISLAFSDLPVSSDLPSMIKGAIQRDNMKLFLKHNALVDLQCCCFCEKITLHGCMHYCMNP